MRLSSVVITVFVACAIACAPNSASLAAPVTVDAGATVDALDANHGINAPGSWFLAPLPFATLNARHGRVEVAAEWLPSLGLTLENGVQATDLSVLLASARYHIGNHFIVGAGTSLINQISTFQPFVSSVTFFRTGTSFVNTTTDTALERSRVVGPRFEAGYEDRRLGLTLVASASPNMHGIVNDHCVQTVTDNPKPLPCFRADVFSINELEYETASEVDVALRIVHPISHHADLVYGWRYINYVGSVIGTTSGTDTDRNVGTGPTVGIRYRL